VADAHLRGHLDGSAGEIAAAGHDELYVVHHFEHLFGGAQEVLGAFLVGDATEEQDDLFVLVDPIRLGVEAGAVAVAVGLDAVMDDLDFFRIDAVVVGDLILGR